MSPLLRLTEIRKSFGGVRALRGVSFELLPGEVHALIGENGAGKSTLIRVITGAIRADGGSIEVDGTPVDLPGPARMRALGIAPIYQQPALFPDLSVAENMAVGLEPLTPWRRIDWAARRKQARALLARVGAAIDVDAAALSLRIAEQQLVEIARALGARARILLMDEPTASLTTLEANRLFELVRSLRAEGVGIVYISHRLDEVDALADRVTILRDGELVGTRMRDTPRDELIRLMVGREVSEVFPKRPVPIGEIVLDVREVGSRAAGVRKVTFSVRAGEVVGLAGLVGAGRTELARVLFGLTPADSGEIHVMQRPATIDSPRRAITHGVAYLPEDRRRHGVVQELSVTANATLAALRRFARFGWLDTAAERAATREFVDRLAIKTPSLDAPVATLSGGNQQKVALARWLATKPAVLILDEPTQGVDVGAKAEIHRLIVELAEQGLAILLISSELPEVIVMSDRVGVMRSGTLAGVLDRPETTPEAILSLALGSPAAGPAASLPLHRGQAPAAH